MVERLPSAYELVRVRADDARAEAVRRARAGAEEGLLVWVEEPLRPRGRLGRPWLEGPDGGLHAALVLRPGLPAATCAELGIVAAVALGSAVAETVQPMAELHYRWPNDVLLDGGKVGAVWLEGGGSRDDVDWLVIACALNAGRPPVALGLSAAGLAVESSDPMPDRASLLTAFARHLLAGIEDWDECGVAPTLQAWRHRLHAARGLRIVLPEGTVVEGSVEQVDADGTLHVRDARDESRAVPLAAFFDLPGTSA